MNFVRTVRTHAPAYALITVIALSSAFYFSNLAAAQTTTESTVEIEAVAELETSTNERAPELLEQGELDTQSLENECGSFIWEFDEEEFIDPIENCDNPFNEDAVSRFPATLFLNDVELNDGDEVALDLTVEHRFRTETNTSPFSQRVSIFKHEGNNYRRLQPNFEDAYILDVGTYSAVIVGEDELILNQNTWFDRLLAVVLPKASAFYADISDVQVITFTVVEASLEPECEGVCASSVLFLPGIQASRLYESQIGIDDRVWEPLGNGDVERLEMTIDGESVNEIYTKDILSSAYGLLGIYEEFSTFMDGLVGNEIVSWQAVPYDWRYNVFDVVQNGITYENETVFLQDILTELAENSHTSKVTIVAHSNGGLLAKALLIEHPELANLVDNIIFVGTPQTGAAKAIGTVLHGYDQEQALGYLIDDLVARKVIENLPGVYGLIPNQTYLDAVNNPVISFSDSSANDVFRNVYGDAVNNEGELFRFMTGEEGRLNAGEDIDRATKANPGLLSEALEYRRSLLDQWLAPKHIKVTEIVGVGLDTERGFEYRPFNARICNAPLLCSFRELYKPVPLFTQYGDQTVVGESAEAYQGEKKTLFLNLRAAISNGIRNKHADLTESASVQEVILNVLVSSSSESVPFISVARPEIAEEKLILATHSPVSLKVKTTSGQVVGIADNVLREDIPGSSYRELAGSHYIIVPADQQFQIAINGEGEGSVTFTVSSLDGSVQQEISRLEVATITVDTVVSVNYTGSEFENTLIDENGDGVIDYEYTPDGQLVLPEVVTYQTLRLAINDLNLNRQRTRPLIALLDVSEYFDTKGKRFQRVENALLQQLGNLMSVYSRKRYVTVDKASYIQQIILELRN
jgi:pimeloyl-ACP methyl ester carboxylesterase